MGIGVASFCRSLAVHPGEDKSKMRFPCFYKLPWEARDMGSALESYGLHVADLRFPCKTTKKEEREINTTKTEIKENNPNTENKENKEMNQ